MKNAASRENLHAQHLKWAIDFCEQSPGMFGWEGPDQTRHRFYEFVRDSNLQGDDYALYHVENLTGPPEEFLKTITSERMEAERKNFGDVLSRVAEENGFLKLEIGKGSSSASMILRAATEAHPFQLVFTTGLNPVIQALWLHILYSRREECRIRRCENCGRIFLREGKKPRVGDRAYCGTSCTRAAVTKRYLEERKAKADAAKESAAAVKSKSARATKAKIRKPRK